MPAQRSAPNGTNGRCATTADTVDRLPPTRWCGRLRLCLAKPLRTSASPDQPTRVDTPRHLPAYDQHRSALGSRSPCRRNRRYRPIRSTSCRSTCIRGLLASPASAAPLPPVSPATPRHHGSPYQMDPHPPCASAIRPRAPALRLPPSSLPSRERGLLTGDEFQQARPALLRLPPCPQDRLADLRRILHPLAPATEIARQI